MQDILYGFTAALSLTNLIASVLSVIVGIAVGSLPGLSAAMGVALLIPITFGMPPETALIALAGVYVGAMFGGSISAILLHTPGTSSAAATAIDGYPMTLKGEAGKAIAAASWASFIGGIISAVALYTLSPLLAKLALQFGPTEYFWLSIFGLTIIAGVSSKSMLKGLISGALGLVLSTIGMDPMLGTQRFIFGSNSLLDGLPFTATLIGLFSMSQVLMLAEKKIKERREAEEVEDNISLTKDELKRILPITAWSGIIGTVSGILPGAGGTIASFIGYNEAKRFTRPEYKDKFGTGIIEGVAGPESANNAVTGGSLIPTLTLGIPGNSVTAILLGGLIIQGLRPGPDLFTAHGKITYTFFAGFVVVNIFMLILGQLGVKYFAKIGNISDSILIPVIFTLSVIGSYSIANNMTDVWVMFIFGLVGYMVNKLELNSAAIVLALILGPIGEQGLRRTLIMNKGNVFSLFNSVISLVLIAISVLSLLTPFIMGRIDKRKE